LKAIIGILSFIVFVSVLFSADESPTSGMISPRKNNAYYYYEPGNINKEISRQPASIDKKALKNKNKAEEKKK
jgi:hypothetical protein